MNCPYTWTSTIDEEDDESSSLESELEGEGPEELASLEPDDKRGWRWPMRNRIIRWGKRSDPRPTFHYLTEDGGEEQALGGLKHLLRRHAEGGSVDVEEGHRRGRLGGGGQRDAEELVSRNWDQSNAETQGRKRVQGFRRRAHQEIRAASRVRQDP